MLVCLKYILIAFEGYEPPLDYIILVCLKYILISFEGYEPPLII